MLAALVAATGSVAHADDFSEAAEKAVELPSPAALSALFWSQEAKCSAYKNDAYRRQCEGLREARASLASGRTYLIEGSGALEVGEYDPAKKATAVAVRACVACGEDGDLIVGRGKLSAKKGEIEAAELQVAKRTFADDRLGNHWTQHIAPRLRTQFLVALPRRAERGRAAGRNAYQVEIRGVRVYDPCKGEVLWSRPKSSAGPVDVSACKGEPKLAAAEPAIVEEVAPKGPEAPEQLKTNQISEALKPAMEKARRCYDAYLIPGAATFTLVISGEGKLVSAEQSGDFVDTPTGLCVAAAIQATQFPKTAKKRTTITYPVILR